MKSKMNRYLAKFIFPPIFLILMLQNAAGFTVDEGNDTINPVHYTIRINDIDMGQQEITAHTTIKIASQVEGLDNIRLDFKTLAVDSVFVNNNTITGFNQTGSHLYIPLGTTFSNGDTIFVDVYYHGVPYHESWGGFHFSGNYAFNLGVGISEIPHNLGKSWFPCLDNFTDRAIYDIYATIDEGMIAVCGGLLIEETNNGNGTITQHWHCSHSLPTYLASVAIGDYVKVSDTYNGLEGDIPIDIYVRPQDSSKVAGTFVNLQAILAQFEDRMGPYPFERVGYVSTAIGAMEHATNIALPHFTISGNTSNESLIAHELTHMWLGDNVTCCSAEEMWLNEGWATFFQYYYGVELYGFQSFKDNMRDVNGDVLQYCHTPGGDGDYFELNNIPQTHTYGMTAYDRGSTVVQAMRFYLGDSLFFDGLAAYNDAFAYQPACSYDMRDFFTSHTGVDMTGFFDNWVFNAGTPHYTIDSMLASPVENEWEVTIWFQQKRKGPAFTGDDNIVEFTLMGEDWAEFTDTLKFSGLTGMKTVTVPFEPAAVFLDLEEQMCDATTDEYKVIQETGDHNYDKTFCKLEVTSITDSAFIQVTHNWAPPDSLTEPANGMRLSDYRYWRIEGVLPTDFDMTAYFFYGTNGYLDNTLITSPTDSVIILHREDSRDDWQEVPFTQLGPWNVGNLIVENAQPGEYTLAVWDTQVGLNDRIPENQYDIKFYPNPANHMLYINYSALDDATLVAYDSSGRMVYTQSLQANQGSYRLSIQDIPAGTYLFQVIDDRHEVLASKKIIINTGVR
jgi:aminopeptidase N